MQYFRGNYVQLRRLRTAGVTLSKIERQSFTILKRDGES